MKKGILFGFIILVLGGAALLYDGNHLLNAGIPFVDQNGTLWTIKSFKEMIIAGILTMAFGLSGIIWSWIKKKNVYFD
jgi:uncharacterized protein YdaL